ncbi:SGNH/GDSL hydrolase family protein [Tundrisphaera lichenicola]|uniref:SGNH/GDSL hydrolase family protein n=1 Tax=Tundrisphaera lichenicola TaxID=2029860 RepID=UPI003EBBC23F
MFAVVVLAVLSGLGHPARAGFSTYLSLGDSIAFGETDFTQDPSFGDRGFVGHYADFLATLAGGVRPEVVNLAIDGESTSSFFSGAGRNNAGFPDDFVASLNLNYDPAAIVSQHAKFLSTIATQAALGNSIDTVTISLGANDLFLLAGSAAFQSADAAGKQALLLQTLGAIANNEGALLAEVHALLPGARVFVLGQYNPFPADPTHPFAGLAGPAILGLNATLESLAPAFGATYVDIYSPFVGREKELTLFAAPDYNVHPNQAGYSVIAGQIALASVPEPSSLVLSALALPVVLAWRWGRDRLRVAA